MKKRRKKMTRELEKALTSKIKPLKHLGLRKKIKRKKEKPPRIERYRPLNQPSTKFMRVLEGWKTIAMKHSYEGVEHVFEYMVSPKKIVYRYAQSWENPTLVIDAEILPPAHHIRLVRVLDKHVRLQVKKELQRRIKRFGN